MNAKRPRGRLTYDPVHTISLLQKQRKGSRDSKPGVAVA